LTYEDTTDSANLWLDAQADLPLYSSSWLEVEVQSALSRKLRTGRLSIVERDACLHRFRASLLPALSLVAIDAEVFSLASTLCQHHELGIRAPDALHLAAASTSGHTLATFDRHLASGAAALGYAVELLA
jgi:predicted nucleic acid-binding protein